ncbi:unnamed protein product [Caenorhabditis brenneri]
MYDIDFTIPYWLITYYHVIGSISLMFDAFSVYLILFKSSKIDNFRYFLLNFQLACSLTDIHLTFLMQPVPLYPLVSGYILGIVAHFGATTHHCMVVVIGCLIYQIESMIFCFVRKHQAIATTLKRYIMPNWLVWSLFFFFAFDILAVVGMYSQTCMDQELQFEYIRENYHDYLSGFETLPNFSIYDPDTFFVVTVLFAVICGIVSFFILCLILANIFRMLSILKTQISTSNYQKHRAAIWSLLAQFATSSVCVVPPIFFVFVVLIGIDGAQIIVELLLVIACLHSSLNVTVLILTFPPYRKFVVSLIMRKRYYLLNFQIVCCLFDIHLTFLVQPVPLYPLVAGYILGVAAHSGATLTTVDQEKRFDYVAKNFPEYLESFKTLSNFSIYIADNYFLTVILTAVSAGIFTFSLLCLIILNIFRMLAMLKTQISAANYHKHRVAVWSLLAQFGTSSVCFVPSMAYVLWFILAGTVLSIVCCLFDIHFTFVMQPVPLYPLVAGYILGVSVYFGAAMYHCMLICIALMIYQVESMVFCFVKKHQTIANTLKKYVIPENLVRLLFVFFVTAIICVIVFFSRTTVDQEKRFDYIAKNFPEYLDAFQTLPNFSIYIADAYFIIVVLSAVSAGIFSFSLLCLIILNIFRMLGMLKTQISASNYHKHRVAVWSLLAQFATSSCCFVPPICYVFVVLVGWDGTQLVVEYLLVIACLHSPLNVTVLVLTFPPYRKFVISLIRKQKKQVRIGLAGILLKPSSIVIP